MVHTSFFALIKSGGRSVPQNLAADREEALCKKAGLGTPQGRR